MDEEKSAKEILDEMARDFDRLLSRVYATDDLEENVLVGGVVMMTHPKSACVGPYCTIHNNSDHHMVKWPQHWRADRRIMERICPHEIGHPDPDDPKSSHPDEWVHGCDGCCNPKSQFIPDVSELMADYEEKK